MMGRLRESKWVYVISSVLLATMFWLYVRSVQDPVNSGWFRNVDVNMTGVGVLTQQGLTVSDLSNDAVTLRIEAPSSVLDNLYRYRSDISVTVDVSRCQEGENKLTYKVNLPTNFNTDGVVIQSQEPETITVTVEKLYTNTFDVEFQLVGKVADGYQAGTPGINPETVLVSGPVDQVSQIHRVVAVLENENLDKRFAGDLPLKLFNAAGEELTDLEVTLDSPSAYVVVPVVVVKDIPITVQFVAGGGATEADIVSKSISPQSITVSGAEEDIENLTEISLGSIDLSQVVGSNTFIRPIELDPSLENVSGITSATVSVSVEGLSTRSFEVENITLSNVPSGYKVISATQVRTVIVRGREEALDTIAASQLRIVADMSEITSVGTYSVPVKVYLDASNAVGVIGDYNIVVNVSK